MKLSSIALSLYIYSLSSPLFISFSNNFSNLFLIILCLYVSSPQKLPLKIFLNGTID
jgi:hypothetical protein